jgi:hypothetical protein
MRSLTSKGYARPRLNMRGLVAYVLNEPETVFGPVTQPFLSAAVRGDPCW